MRELIFDDEIATGTDTALSGGYHRLESFEVQETRIVSEIGVVSTGYGNVKTNIYVGQTSPSTLVYADNTSKSVSPGINFTKITNKVILYKNKTYWIGVVGDVNGTSARDSVNTNTNVYYSSVDYGTFNAPQSLSGYSSVTGAKVLMSLFGYSPTGFMQDNGCVGNGCVGNGLVGDNSPPGTFKLKQYIGKVLRYNNCAWSSSLVDEYLISALSSVLTSCSIDLSGSNGARTSKSDSAYFALIGLGNSITVN